MSSRKRSVRRVLWWQLCYCLRHPPLNHAGLNPENGNLVSEGQLIIDITEQWKLLSHEPRQFAQGLASLTCVRYATGSNLGQDADNHIVT
jgi:hypothetical protein